MKVKSEREPDSSLAGSGCPRIYPVSKDAHDELRTALNVPPGGVNNITERAVQSAVMSWIMERPGYETACTNVTSLFPWECDVVALTKDSLVHEFEVKISMRDYLQDAKKHKHYLMSLDSEAGPSCFWYVTYQLDIKPPPGAGWLSVEFRDGEFVATERKTAPCRHTNPMECHRILARLLALRLVDELREHAVEDPKYLKAYRLERDRQVRTLRRQVEIEAKKRREFLSGYYELAEFARWLLDRGGIPAAEAIELRRQFESFEVPG